MTDKDYMQIAIDISKKAKYPFGAIIVKDGDIIGRSDVKVKNKSMIDHAEYVAILDACGGSLYNQLSDCTIYSSCEPCLICLGTILYEGINKIVYGATIQDSNEYYVPETCVGIKEIIARPGKNVEIKNILRKQAVEVLKQAK